MSAELRAWSILKKNPNLGMFGSILAAYGSKTSISVKLSNAYAAVTDAIAERPCKRSTDNSPIHEFQESHTNAECIALLQEIDV